MKNFILLVALFLVAPFAQGSSPQHLLVGGSGWNKIAIINKDTKEIVWEYPLEKGWECNSVAATKAGEKGPGHDYRGDSEAALPGGEE